MPDYKAPLRDIRFVRDELLGYEDTLLDLTNKSVFNVSVVSENATGTTFKVSNAQTAFQIVGGNGVDTIEVSGFTLSAAEMDFIFATTSIEQIVRAAAS